MTYLEKLKIITSSQEAAKYKTLYTIPSPEACIHFINNFCFTYDPRRKNDRVIPFKLFEKQEEFIRWLWNNLHNKESGVVDKCRDVGATWCFCAFSVFLLLFVKDLSIGFFTYKASECDTQGDISTLFGKVRFLLNKIPSIFKPKKMLIKNMHVKNLDNGTDIAGASGDNPGRSGRRTIFFKDESAFYSNSVSIEAALSETSDCLIDVSTHAGTNTLFYTKSRAENANVFTFDWWENPMHDKEWYDKKRNKAVREGLLHIFKREIDRDPLSSVDSILIKKNWIESAINNMDEITGKKILAFDPQDEGMDLHAACIFEGNKLVFVDNWGEGDTGEATKKVLSIAMEWKIDELRYDATGIGTGVKTTINMMKENSQDDRLHKIRIVPWVAGAKTVNPKEEDYNDTPNENMFENAKAQAYWTLRDQIYHTHLKAEKDDYIEENLINLSLLKNHQWGNKTLNELGQPQYKTSANGRFMIDKKPKGTRSPNIADTIMMARAPIEFFDFEMEVF